MIVYERLQDAFLGKVGEDGQTRKFENSDFKKFESLFIPEHLRDEVFAFVQSSVVVKEQIGKKIVGDGQIILTNWHIFLDKTSKAESSDTGLFWNDDPLENAKEIVEDILPLTP